MKIKVTLGTMQNASKLVSIAESISCDVDLCYGRYIVDAKSTSQEIDSAILTNFLRCGSLLWTLYCGREIHAWSLKPAGFCIWRIADSS